MKKTLLFISLYFLFALFLSAQTTHHVQMSTGDQFVPQNITVEKGDIIQWTNADSEPHTSTSGTSCTSDGNWDSGSIAPGGTFSFTFNTVGSFPYYCTFHCAMGMVGSVTVTEPGITGNKAITLNNIELKAFPNPFTEFSHVEFTLEQQGKVKIHVKDIIGNVVFETAETLTQSGKQSIALPGADWKSGIYVFTIFLNDVPVASEYLVKSR